MKKCGFVAIIGRPNVGKSTLLNHILKYKISITSRKPQTTRHQITGIKTIENTQFIYVDTPGLHQDEPRAINRMMNKQASSVINDVDVILFVVEVGKWTTAEEWILQKIESVKVPVILVINKVDQLNNRHEAVEFTDEIKQKYPFAASFLVSAKQGHLINDLESKIESYLPESEHFFYAEDQVTDRTERFMMAEIIREKLMRTLGQEVPYQLTVEINKSKFDEARQIMEVYATILVERAGQKAMVIGAKGQKLKKIGSEARQDMEFMLGRKVFLQLWVKVKEGWSDDDRALKSLGYDF
ncbi:GTPase Era [Cysteiniphilum sp. QT6929]|uniref:GTPase Era n=1 Tax=Cysteiniphilum sp. QT6929 TaxID=2975055 RepID=UPI0024B37CE9|nr:GTPase Era [Cysteiniphilum sp. QT6929]WHN65679.1 GTPase Era [Cysteiniphilum sp. QT6929]